jgi:RNA polymerase sigma-70 factor (sigma-E family)
MAVTVQLVVEQGVASDVPTQRDEEFAAYMTARQPSLLRTAYLLTGDQHTAEDLVQTALAKLYLSWDKVQHRELVDGYVRRILVNEHNSLWRRAWKRRELSSDTLPDDQGSYDRHDDGSSGALWEFVQTLPRRQRAVIVLRYYEGMSEADIAETLRIRPGTVKSAASAAMARLRSTLTETVTEIQIESGTEIETIVPAGDNPRGGEHR